jgi:hypothetical protein
MDQVSYVVVSCGSLDEYEGTSFSLPESFDNLEDARSKYKEIEGDKANNAAALIEVDGANWRKINAFGQDEVYLARDPWGGFALLPAPILDMPPANG